MPRLHFPILLLVLCLASAAADAQIKPSREPLAGAYPGQAYSPYAQRNFPDHVYWGDTHLHTGLSVDAGLFGARLGLDDAHHFARGRSALTVNRDGELPGCYSGCAPVVRQSSRHTLPQHIR